MHLADTGFVDAELMLAAKQKHGVELCGPSHLDQQWQSRHDPRFCAENFSIDWRQKKAVCPAGKTSLSWSGARTDTAKQVIKIKFSMTDCQVCAFRQDCTKSRVARRTLTILPEDQFEIRRGAREREKTWDYQKQYDRRSGIEGTISQAVRGFGVRRSRYIGEAKTHLQQVVSAAAINVARVSNWLNEVPLAETRQPLFARVMRETCWSN